MAGSGHAGGVEVDQRLRAQGYRVTTGRRLVWDVLSAASGHLTVEEVHARVAREAPEVNLATVYRTLALLDELDLAHEVQLGDGRGRWELAHPDEQLHLACRVCGSVTHHPGDAVRGIRDHLGREHSFTAESVEVVVTGLCAACDAPPHH